MKNETGMALVPMILTVFIVLAILGAAIFMIGDGLIYNKEVRRTVQENTVNNNNILNEAKNWSKEALIYENRC